MLVKNFGDKSIQLFMQTNPEIVKRWSNEVQEAVQSRAALVQFHAVGLLHQVHVMLSNSV